jgi:hypothetical protein
VVSRGINIFLSGPVRGATKEREAFNDDKKRLILSQKGEPVGSMKEVFKKDLNAFVKQLNPCYNWDNQADEDRDSFWERMDSEYDYVGEKEKLCNKFFRGEISRAISRWSTESFSCLSLFCISMSTCLEWCSQWHPRDCILIMHAMLCASINMM